MKIALIPIDNRPVCYTLPKEIANIDNSLKFFLPDRKLLGGLLSSADIEGIFAWLDTLEEIDAMVISLDTIAHGGLIPSRRSKDSFEEIKSRLENFREKLSGKCKKIYAFSSIMRISNNNVNEEEKEYWSEYGKKIFEYSYTFHKKSIESADIPKEILNDYLATRQRNFRINKMYIDWLEEGLFDTLVFSKDDCAEYGLNVLEAKILQNIIEEKNLAQKNRTALIKTGADEIPLTLFARAVCDYNIENQNSRKNPPKISLSFLAPEYKDLISNYEDISIEKSTLAQLELAKCEAVKAEESDIVLLVNNFEEKQGEIVMGLSTKPFSGKLELPHRPFMIADVRFANGADNKFIGELFKHFHKPNKSLNSYFYGYSGWNTSANSLGSLICAGVVRFFAESEDEISENRFSQDAFKKVQMIRFLDDWAYQSIVRQALKKLSERPDVRQLKKLMLPFEKKLNKLLGINLDFKYKFPWKRFFEVEVIIK